MPRARLVRRAVAPVVAAVLAAALTASLTGCTSHPSLVSSDDSDASLSRMVVVADAAMTASGFHSWRRDTGESFTGPAQESWAGTADCDDTQSGFPVRVVGQRPSLTVSVDGMPELTDARATELNAAISSAWKALGVDAKPSRPGRGPVNLLGSDDQVTASWNITTGTLTVLGLCVAVSPHPLPRG